MEMDDSPAAEMENYNNQAGLDSDDETARIMSELEEILKKSEQIRSNLKASANGSKDRTPDDEIIIIQEEIESNGEGAKTLETNEISDQTETLQSSTDDQNSDQVDSSLHPYKHLLEEFLPFKEQLEISPIVPAKTLKQTKLILVQTKDSLLTLLKDVENLKEIAVNAHVQSFIDGRNYIPIIEISTGSLDYLIDVDKLKEDISLLAKIFLNPNIVKIMFLSQLIMHSLQRHLQLFFVNIFDLDMANEKLEKSPLIMKDLVKRKYSFESDYVPIWRIEKKIDLLSLNERATNYYRYFSHFLMYSYHEFKNRLIESGLLEEVMEECKEACKAAMKLPYENLYQELQHELKIRHEFETQLLENIFNMRNDRATLQKVHPLAIMNQKDVNRFIWYLPLNLAKVYSYFGEHLPKRFAKDVCFVTHKLLREFEDKYKIEIIAKEQLQTQGGKNSISPNNKKGFRQVKPQMSPRPISKCVIPPFISDPPLKPNTNSTQDQSDPKILDIVETNTPQIHEELSTDEKSIPASRIPVIEPVQEQVEIKSVVIVENQPSECEEEHEVQAKEQEELLQPVIPTSDISNNNQSNIDDSFDSSTIIESPKPKRRRRLKYNN